MTYQQLTYFHLATILPAFLIGTFLLWRRKGTPLHKTLGRIYLPLMIATGLTTLLMPAQVGPRFLDHFGFIHAFSLLTLYSAPAAYLAVRRGDIKAHRGNMIGLYVGGILIAGAFALAPGRMLHDWIFGPRVHSYGTPPASAAYGRWTRESAPGHEGRGLTGLQPRAAPHRTTKKE